MNPKIHLILILLLGFLGYKTPEKRSVYESAGLYD